MLKLLIVLLAFGFLAYIAFTGTWTQYLDAATSEYVKTEIQALLEPEWKVTTVYGPNQDYQGLKGFYFEATGPCNLTGIAHYDNQTKKIGVMPLDYGCWQNATGTNNT